MQLTDEDGWNNTVKLNTINDEDPYGKAILDYAERWANMFEQAATARAGGRSWEDISFDEELSPIFEATSRAADTEGITGAMYASAVSILSQVWEHGDVLVKWHNRQWIEDREAADAATAAGKLASPHVSVEAQPSTGDE